MNEKILELKKRQLIDYMTSTAAGKSENVKQAFLKVRRENFMPENVKEVAYIDEAIPIGFGQTISQPSTIAIMLELLGVEEGQTVLEVGSGCGYVLALLNEIVGEKGKVYGVEIIPELVEISKQNLKKENYKNIEVIQTTGEFKFDEKIQFDRILISCASPFIPKPLFDKLKERGRIVAPTGDKFTQVMTTMEKIKGKMLKKEYMEGYFRFVPMKGKHGFR